MALNAVVATCLMMAAQNYNVPPAVMLGIMHVEGGKVGQAVGPNTNGTYDLGPMQVNTMWAKTLSGYWKVNYSTAMSMIKDDPCINVHVAAWILRQRLNESGNLTLAIAHYHSKTPKFGYVYARKVIGAMRRMSLLQD